MRVRRIVNRQTRSEPAYHRQGIVFGGALGNTNERPWRSHDVPTWACRIYDDIIVTLLRSSLINLVIADCGEQLLR